MHDDADASAQQMLERPCWHHHAALALGHNGFRAACQLILPQALVGSCGLLLGQLHGAGLVRRLFHNDIGSKHVLGNSAWDKKQRERKSA